MLDLSKIEANRMDTFAEDVEVAGLVEGVAETVGTLVEQKNNVLAVEVAPGVGAMHTDVVQAAPVPVQPPEQCGEVHG